MKIDSILIYVTFSKAYVVYQIDCFDGGVVRLCTLDWVFIGGTWHDWGVHSPSGTRFSVAKVNFKIPCISGNWSGMKEKVNLLHTPTKVKDRCCCHTIFFFGRMEKSWSTFQKRVTQTIIRPYLKASTPFSFSFSPCHDKGSFFVRGHLMGSL